jgi:hypothetical protein
LSHEEGTFQVGIENVVPEFFLDIERGADLLDPRIVDQDVEAAQLVESLAKRLCGSPRRLSHPLKPDMPFGQAHE